MTIIGIGISGTVVWFAGRVLVAGAVAVGLLLVTAAAAVAADSRCAA